MIFLLIVGIPIIELASSFLDIVSINEKIFDDLIQNLDLGYKIDSEFILRFIHLSFFLNLPNLNLRK